MKIQIPSSLGVIIESVNLNSDLEILVLPKKVANPYLFEKGTVKLVDYLVEKYDINLFVVDGVNGKIDLTMAKMLAYTCPVEGVIKSKWDSDMKAGKMTGLEYFMLTRDKDIITMGMEDKELYIQSLKLIGTTQSNISIFRTSTDLLRKKIIKLRESILDPSLEFDKNIEEYESRKKDILQHYNYIAKKAEEVNINLEQNYPKFYDAIQSLNHQEVLINQERALMSKISHAILFGDSKEQEDLELEDDVEGILDLKTAISRLAMSDGQATVERALRLNLAQTDEQKELVNLYNNLEMLVNLTDLEGTPQTFDKFKIKRHEFSLQYFSEALSKYSIKLSTILIDSINNLVPTMEQFYEIAEQRQKIFVDKTLNAMDENGQKVAVMSFAGFNAPGVLNLLNKKEISYHHIATNDSQ